MTVNTRRVDITLRLHQNADLFCDACGCGLQNRRGQKAFSTSSDGLDLNSIFQSQDAEGSTGYAVNSRYLTSGADIDVLFEAETDGQHDLEMYVGNQVITYQITVDTQSPSVQGSISLTNQLPANIDPNAASSIPETFNVELEILLNFSKPISPLSMDSFLTRHLEVLSINMISEAVVLVDAAGQWGTTAELFLPYYAYQDFAGNFSIKDADLALYVGPSSYIDDDLGQGASIGVGGILGTGVVVSAGATAAGRAFSFRGGLLQSTYHVQFLAMTANLAVPGLSYSYRQLARFFRWSVLAVEGGELFSQPGGGGMSNVVPSRRSLLDFQVKSGNSTGDSEETHGQGFQEADSLQSVLYVLVVCAIILAAIVVAHLLFIVLFARFSSSPLPPSLLFPRFEFAVTALLLVALTFYSTLTLSSNAYGTPATKSAAYAILCVRVTPFGCFLWWLTLGRLLAQKVESNSAMPEADDDTQVPQDDDFHTPAPGAASQGSSMYTQGPHWQAFTGAMPPPRMPSFLPHVGPPSSGPISEAQHQRLKDSSTNASPACPTHTAGPHWQQFQGPVVPSSFGDDLFNLPNLVSPTSGPNDFQQNLRATAPSAAAAHGPFKQPPVAPAGSSRAVAEAAQPHVPCAAAPPKLGQSLMTPPAPPVLAPPHTAQSATVLQPHDAYVPIPAMAPAAPADAAQATLPSVALPAAHSNAAAAPEGGKAAAQENPPLVPHEQGTVFSDEQQGSTFLAPGSSLFAKAAPTTQMALSHPEHELPPDASNFWTASMEVPRATSDPLQNSHTRVTPHASSSSKGGADGLVGPRTVMHAHSFSGAHHAVAPTRAAFGPHARSAAGSHDSMSGQGAALQSQPLHSTSASEAGLSPTWQASPVRPFAWQDGPGGGLDLQADQRQPVGEANEQPRQQGVDQADTQGAVLQETALDFQEHSLMSMMLPSDATHKRYAFIFGDTVKGVRSDC